MENVGSGICDSSRRVFPDGRAALVGSVKSRYHKVTYFNSTVLTTLTTGESRVGSFSPTTAELANPACDLDDPEPDCADGRLVLVAVDGRRRVAILAGVLGSAFDGGNSVVAARRRRCCLFGLDYQSHQS